MSTASNHENPLDLTGQVAVVTGGGSGIGFGMANGLAQAGASVAIIARNKERLEDAASKLREHGNTVLALPCDVTDEHAIAATISRVHDELGRLDSCFANAGVGSGYTPLIDTSLEEFRSVTAVNLDAVFVTLREAARHMIAAGNGGSLVAVSSMAACFGTPRQHSYGASKAALVSLVKSIAVELARYGIRANAIQPGWVDTPMLSEGLSNERFVDQVLRRVPVRRWGRSDDCAGIAVYLASPASAFHTGDALLVDGGYSAF